MDPTELLTASLDATPAQVRRRAARKLGVGLLLLPVSALLLRWLLPRITGLGIVAMLIMLAPAALCLPFLVGLVELVTGLSLLELSGRWNSLAGWQRGVIGLVAVLAVLGLFVGGMALYSALDR